MVDHYTGENVVFLLGSPRSGTTWLQKLLASHSSIRTAQESNFFVAYARSLMRDWQDDADDKSGRGGTGLPCYLTEEQFYEVLADLFKRTVFDIAMQGESDHCLFLEKTPSHALVVGNIHRVLPEARYILIIRDPRDVVASLLAAHRSWGKHWAPSNMFTALRMWYTHITTARTNLEKLPAHLGFTLRYEDLVLATEETLSAIFSFLGLTISSEELAVLIEENAMGSQNSDRTSLKVFGAVGAELQGVLKEPEGFVRKGRPGSWREDIGWFRGMAIKCLVTKEMKRYGYR